MFLSLELAFSKKNQRIFSFTYLQSHRLSQKVLCEHNALLQDLLSAQLHNILLFFSFSYSRLFPFCLVTAKQNSMCNLPSPTSLLLNFWLPLILTAKPAEDVPVSALNTLGIQDVNPPSSLSPPSSAFL